MERGVELHARAGRAVLIGYGDEPWDATTVELPDDLTPALHEWAQVAETVLRSGRSDTEPGELVSRRGRQLAARLAAVAGLPVGYADPIDGGVHVIRPSRPESTPWQTGMVISVVTATTVLVAVLALSDALATVAGWLVVAANLVVAVGLAPSVWLARSVPVWRWVAYGVPVGVGVGWLVLLLSLLGPAAL